MTVLLANLRHFYQRRNCWVMGAVLGIFGIALAVGLARTESGEAVLMVAFWMYLTAIFVAQMQIEVLVAPLAWCLPGHREAATRMLFIVGALLSSVWAGTFMLHPGLAIAGRLGMGLSIFFMALGAYCLGSWMVFRCSKYAAGLLLVVVFFTASWTGTGRAFSTASPTGWLVGSILGGLVCYLTHGTLNLTDFARGYCGVPTLRPFEADPRRAARFAEASGGRKEAGNVRVRPGVERFFLRRIRGARGVAPYVWGHLYTSETLRRKYWLWWPIIAGMICYFMAAGGEPSTANILFVLPAAAVYEVRYNVRGSLLIQGGRRERFWSALVLAVTSTVCTTALVILIAGATVLIQAAVPELTVGGERMAFPAMDVKYVVVPLAMIPVMLTVPLVLGEKRRLAFGVEMLLVLLAVSAAEEIVNQGVAAYGIMGACWVVFVGVLRWVCMRGRLC